MLALDYHNSPNSPLSGWLATLWASIFGHGLYAMRCLSIVYHEIAIFLCGAYLYWHVRNLKFTLLVTAVSAYLLTFMLTTVFVGWDAASDFMIVAAGLSLLTSMKILTADAT